MSLQKRALIIFCLVLLAMALFLYFPVRLSLIRGFVWLEDVQIQQKVSLMLEEIQQQFDALNVINLDYAKWDESLAYIAGYNPDYIDNNLTNQFLAERGISVVVVTNAEGRILYARAIDPHTHQTIAFPVSLLEMLLVKDNKFIIHNPSDSVQGLLSIPEGLLMVSAHPVTNNSGDEPVGGTLIFGRMFDVTLFSEFGSLGSDDRIQLFRYGDAFPTEVQAALPALTAPGRVSTQTLDENTLLGYTLLKDLNDRPVAILRLQANRPVFKQASAALQTLLLIQLSMGVLLSAAVMVLLNRMVLARLARLNTQVGELARQDDLSRRVLLPGKDEIAGVATTVNYLLEQLESTASIQEQYLKLKTAQERIQFQANLLDMIERAVIATDSHGRVVYWNQFAERLFGWTSTETMGQLAHLRLPVDQTEPQGKLIAQLQHGQSWSGDLLLKRKDNSEFLAAVSARPIMDTHNELTHVLAVVSDMTQVKHTELELRGTLQKLELAQTALAKNEQLYRTMIYALEVGIGMVDPEENFTFVNPAGVLIFGYPLEELIGKNLRSLTSAEEFETVLYQNTLRKQGISSVYEMKIQRQDGEWRTISVHGSPQFRVTGEFQASFAVFRDVTEEHRAAEKLVYLSTHDVLTGLYNRAYFEEELTHCERSQILPTSLIMMDIDGFKHINDSLGHATGDQVLKDVGALLNSVVYGTALAARIGGDEFVILLPGLDARVAAQSIVELQTALQTFNQHTSGPRLTFSIGASTADQPMPLVQIYKQADAQMYRDKAKNNRAARLGL